MLVDLFYFGGSDAENLHGGATYIISPDIMTSRT